MTTPHTHDCDIDASTLWSEIESDVQALFGDDIDVTVREYDEYVDVRILPNGAVDALEAQHEELTIVPYNACQMTIRKQQ
jgi:citrate lyase gamma subunit